MQPTISVLMKLYSCVQSTGEGFSTSFLSSDCHEVCWSRVHLAYTITCSSVLLIYTSLAVLSAPWWQEQQASLHIRAQPLPMLLKLVLQVGLVALRQSFSDYNRDLHNWTFVVTISLYFFFLLRCPLFNYSRYVSRQTEPMAEHVHVPSAALHSPQSRSSENSRLFSHVFGRFSQCYCSVDAFGRQPADLCT